jgi:hypothetical protein
LGQVNLGSDIQEGQVRIEGSYSIVRDNILGSPNLEKAIAEENQYEEIGGGICPKSGELK